MPLDEATQAFIERASLNPAPVPGEIPLAAFREATKALRPLGFEREEVAEVRNAHVPAPGAPDVPVRIYRPQTAEPAPLLVCVHGGSWVRVTVDEVDEYYRVLANRSGCVVVAVDYRLAPESQFPTAIEEAHAVGSWASQNAETLGGDPARIAIFGESSGGNLAAAAALYARTHGGVEYALQILLLPVLDARLRSASWDELGRDYLLTREQLDWAVEQYAPGVDRADPLLSPLCADDVTGLPPALIVTGEFDPLRDDGEAYASRLEEAGVPTRHWRVEGLIHHALMVPRAIPLAQTVMDEFGTAVREAMTDSAMR